MAAMSCPVFLVRHGQSEWNVARLTQGQTPHPRLTDVGRHQAAQAATRLSTVLADAEPVLVSSDLVRARETADVIALLLGVSVSEDVRLREQALGRLEGRPYEETWAAAEAHDWSDPSLPVAGGESPADVYDRMAGAMDDARVMARERPVILVSHGDAIRAALAYARGVGPHAGEWIEVPNGVVLRVTGGEVAPVREAPIVAPDGVGVGATPGFVERFDR